MGRKSKKEGIICICIADSFFCTVETQHCKIFKKLKKKKKSLQPETMEGSPILFLSAELWVPGYSPAAETSFTSDWFSFLEASENSEQEDYKEFGNVRFAQ